MPIGRPRAQPPAGPPGCDHRPRSPGQDADVCWPAEPLQAAAVLDMHQINRAPPTGILPPIVPGRAKIFDVICNLAAPRAQISDGG